MYNFIGTPIQHKRHAAFKSIGHTAKIQGYRNEMVNEVFDWLDQYIGSVDSNL